MTRTRILGTFFLQRTGYEKSQKYAILDADSQIPRRNQRNIKLESPQASRDLTLPEINGKGVMTYMSENKSTQKHRKKRKHPTNDRNVILKQLAKPFCFLLLFIMVCAFLAQYLTGSETLTEYAHNNPDLAYGAAKDVPDTAGTVSQDKSHQTDTETAAPSAAPKSGSTTLKSNAQTPDAPNPENSDKTPSTPVTSENDSTYTTDKNQTEEPSEMNTNPERTTYQPGFYYEPLTDAVKQRITGISYPESGCTVPYEDLRYVGLLYYDFNGEEQTGELICNKGIAQDMIEIFYELYRNDYQIEKIRLIDEYNGDDTASMADNNTSCFNYRVVDGTTNLSKHAYGLAIDINPFYNPYVVYNKGGTGNTYISPAGSEIYADRSQDFAYKIDENDLCYRLFIEHGFTWGGNWNSSKDYQHFQKVLK